MRCAICPNKYRCVPGDGPTPARVLLIGEAPGRDEDSGGRPFIGQAGRELNENYLNLAGLERDEVYITNTVKCRPDLNRKPSTNEAVGCSSHWLPSELELVQPEVVILMGATACSLVVGEDGRGGIDLEAEHGIPRLGELYGWVGWIVPINHPAAGLHDTSMMIPMLEDWERLRGWLDNGTWVWPVDSTQLKDYRLAVHPDDVDKYFSDYPIIDFIEQIGGDTESHNGVPYSIQVSYTRNTGLMVMEQDKPIIRRLGRVLKQRLINGAELVFHYGPADIPAFERMFETFGGYDFRYRDTILEAYGFGCYGRLGLKTLARRVLGRTRLSWEETVTPYSKEVLAQWMMNSFIYAEKNWRIEKPRFHKKSGKPLKPSITSSVPEKLLPELLSHSLKNTDYPIWQKLQERMPEEWMSKLVDACGTVPQRGIAHCPLEVQIEYACSDPDNTRELALRFDSMRKEFVESLNVQDEDVDQ